MDRPVLQARLCLRCRLELRQSPTTLTRPSQFCANSRSTGVGEVVLDAQAIPDWHKIRFVLSIIP